MGGVGQEFIFSLFSQIPFFKEKKNIEIIIEYIQVKSMML